MTESTPPWLINVRTPRFGNLKVGDVFADMDGEVYTKRDDHTAVMHFLLKLRPEHSIQFFGVDEFANPLDPKFYA